MQASPARPAPDQEHIPADDPEIPPWQADYETCPVCHRPVRRERLTRHMELLHADASLADAPLAEEAPAEPEVQAAPGGLRGLLARLFGRRVD